MAYDVDNVFTYHPPLAGMAQQERYERIRDLAKELAVFIVQGDGVQPGRSLMGCPDSPERTRALERLEEAVMLANASIARNEKAAA